MMENTDMGNETELTIPSSITLLEHPWYFGAYLNMAQLNAFKIIKDIEAKFELEAVCKQVNAEYKFTYESPLRYSFVSYWQNRTINDSTPHFDKMQRAMSTSSVNFSGLMKSIIRMIPATRSFFKEIEVEDLNEKTNKESAFNKDSLARMGFFFYKGFEYLATLRNNYSHYFTIDTPRGDEPKRNISLDTEFIEILESIYNFACRELLYHNRITQNSYDTLRKKHICTLVTPDNEFTERGLSFFISLFLERKDAFHFIGKIKGFKDTSTYEHLAVRMLYTHFCIKMPLPRFLSDNNTDALQLDILNYLQRVPKELFSKLKEEDKAKFQPTIEDNKQGNIIQNSLSRFENCDDYDSFISSLSSLDRKSDRFTYYALRLLDEADNFNFSFELSLGKLVKDSYPKHIAGDKITRNIMLEITTFGKVSDFQGETPMNLVNKQLIHENYAKLFKETTYSPKYNVVANKIGISYKASSDGATLNRRQAIAYLSVNELPKILFLVYYKNDNSVNDILKDFIEENPKKLQEALEGNIPLPQFEKLPRRELKADFKINHNDYNQFLSNIESRLAKPYNFKTNNLKNLQLRYLEYYSKITARRKELATIYSDINHYPSRLIDELIHIEEYKSDTFKTWIKEQIHDCKLRVKKLDTGKAPKAGEMATDLAKDIIQHIIDASTNPEKNKTTIKGKITSIYYQKIQESLAFWGMPAYKDKFLKICNELNLFDKKLGHPFLADLGVENINSITQLYRNYYNFKGASSVNKSTKNRPHNWLKTTFYHVKNNKTEIRIPTEKELKDKNYRIPFSYYKKHISTQQSRSVKDKTWIEHQKRNPIKLPTNLFDVEIRNIDALGLNLSLLLKKITNNDKQPFYNLERHYDILFAIKGKKECSYNITIANSKKISDCYKQELKNIIALSYDKSYCKLKFKKQIDENEKIIRYHLMQDRLLCLCLKQLMSKSVKQNFEFKLSEFDLSNKSPLEQQDDIRIEFEYLTDKNDTWKPLKTTYTLVDLRKRKDYGKLHHFSRDFRIKRMAPYYSNSINEVRYIDLEKELSCYEENRLVIFQKVFNLEKYIIENIGTEDFEKIILQNKPKYSHIINIKHHPYLNLLKNKPNGIDSETEKLLTLIRNAYSHNIFFHLFKSGINAEIINNTKPFELEKPISSTLLKWYIDCINKCMKNISL